MPGGYGGQRPVTARAERSLSTDVYLLAAIIEQQLRRAGLDLSAADALQILGRIDAVEFHTRQFRATLASRAAAQRWPETHPALLDHHNGAARVNLWAGTPSPARVPAHSS